MVISAGLYWARLSGGEAVNYREHFLPRYLPHRNVILLLVAHVSSRRLSGVKAAA